MFEVNIKDVGTAQRLLASAIDNWNSVPMLSMALATAAPGEDVDELSLVSTDLDMSVKLKLPCQSSATAGEQFLIPDMRGLASALNAAGGTTALLNKTDDGYRVKAGALVRTTVDTNDPGEFPGDCADIVSQQWQATLTGDIIRKIERLSSAVSTEETRYYLNGIALRHVEDWTYRFAATDGHRLMVQDIQLPDATGKLYGEIILPRRFCRAMFMHLRRNDGPMIIETGFPLVERDGKLTAAEGLDGQRAPRVAISGTVKGIDACFASKLIDGTYPDYARVVPVKPDYQAMIPITTLRRAVLAISAGCSKQSTPVVQLRFVAGGIDCCLYFAAAVTSVYRIECQHNVPEGDAIGFNSGYLLDMLGAIAGSDVTLSFTGTTTGGKRRLDAAAPTLVRDVSDGDWMGVIMPMRIDTK